MRICTIAGVHFRYRRRWKLLAIEHATIVAPLDGSRHRDPIYAFKQHDGTILRVAATEHTPGVYLAFTDNPAHDEAVHPQSTRDVLFR